MQPEQAQATVALLQAFFPRPELPDSTVQAWSSELIRFDFGDAQEGVRRYSRRADYPVLAELIEAIGSVELERLRQELPALPGRKISEQESMRAGAIELAAWRIRRQKSLADAEEETANETEGEGSSGGEDRRATAPAPVPDSPSPAGAGG